MKIQVRRLNASGLELFEKWLISKDGPAPKWILSDDQYCCPIDFEACIDLDIEFDTTFSIGEYLNSSVFVEVDAPTVFSDTEMWAWLSLALIYNLVSKSNKGGSTVGAPLAVNHYVQRGAVKSRQAYRLILRSAWWAVRLHGDGAKIVLGSKESPWGELAEQILGRSQLSSHRVFFAVAKDLYLDNEGNVKRGAAGKRDKNARKNPKARAGLGAIRRLALTLNQFGKTYNTREIPVKTMLSLLPKEYSRFENKIS
jgi:hypothetical protein